MLNVKQVILKSRKVMDNFCTICETFLTGNGSIAYPWKCECGQYEWDWADGWEHPKGGEEQN